MYRAYDENFNWRGPEREALAEALRDVDARNDVDGASAYVVVLARNGRMVTLDGHFIRAHKYGDPHPQFSE